MNNEILERLKQLNETSNLSPLPGDTDAYLEVPEDQKLATPSPESVWVKINEAGELEVIRWDIINMYAARFDADKNARNETHVMCKLLTLVRDQVRKEVARE